MIQRDCAKRVCSSGRPSKIIPYHISDSLEVICGCGDSCSGCFCTDLTGGCPPGPRQPKGYCPPNFCPVKTKRTLWQQLFGDKSVFGSKKKQCRPMKEVCATSKPMKEICVPARGCSPVPACVPDPCARRCKCKPLKCMPTQRSLCGCHFYINLENRPKRKKCRARVPVIYETNEGNATSETCETNETDPTRLTNPTCITDETCETYETNETCEINGPPCETNCNETYEAMPNKTIGTRSRRTIETIHDKTNEMNETNEVNEPKKSTIGSTGQFNSSKRKITSRRTIHCSVPNIGLNNEQKERNEQILQERERRKTRQTLKEAQEIDDNIKPMKIGVTFTRELTQYCDRPCKPTTCCQPTTTEDETCCCTTDTNECESTESNESANELTLEIRNNMNNKPKHTEATQNVEHNDDDTELSVFEDYIQHPNNPHSESMRREIIPLMKKRTRPTLVECGNVDRNHPYAKHSGKQSKGHINASTTKVTRNKSDLEKRVSEILDKLANIEKKISVIERKGSENQDIKIELDGQKSTVSVTLKDPRKRKRSVLEDTDNSVKNRTKVKGSRSCSELDRGQQEKKNIRSLSVDRKKNGIKSNHKIIIKIPNNKNEKPLIYVQEDNDDVNENGQSPSWCDICDDLKLCTPPEKCYCFECMRKRLIYC